MKINFGKCVVGEKLLGKDIILDIGDRTYYNNILSVGSRGTGKTYSILKKIQEFKKLNRSKRVIVITDKPVEYRNSAVDKVIKADKFIDYTKELGENKIIVIDISNGNLHRYIGILNLWRSSRVSNNVIIITSNSLSDIPRYLLFNVNIIELYKIDSDDDIDKNADLFCMEAYKLKQIINKMKPYEKILSIYGNNIMVKD